VTILYRFPVTPSDYEPPGFKVKRCFLLCLFFISTIILNNQVCMLNAFYLSCAGNTKWFFLFRGWTFEYQSWRCVNGKETLLPLHIISGLSQLFTDLGRCKGNCDVSEGCPILRQIYAWNCIVFTSHNNTVQKHNNKEWSKTIRILTMLCINLSEYWTSMMCRNLKQMHFARITATAACVAMNFIFSLFKVILCK